MGALPVDGHAEGIASIRFEERRLIPERISIDVVLENWIVVAPAEAGHRSEPLAADPDQAKPAAAARAIKAVNPATKVLYYRNVIVHYGNYAANDALATIPGAFLLNREGGDKLVRNRVQAYDLTNARLRDWWLSNRRR